MGVLVGPLLSIDLLCIDVGDDLLTTEDSYASNLHPTQKQHQELYPPAQPSPPAAALKAAKEKRGRPSGKGQPQPPEEEKGSKGPKAVKRKGTGVVVHAKKEAKGKQLGQKARKEEEGASGGGGKKKKPRRRKMTAAEEAALVAEQEAMFAAAAARHREGGL